MFRRMTPERFLSDDQLARLMAVVRERHHLNQPRDYALIALLANTGIRPSEALTLTRADVHPHARPPWIRVMRLKKRHAADPITKLPLHPKVAKVLANYVDQLSGKRTDKLFDFTKRQSFRLFRYYAGKAGLPLNLRIYSLRHTVGMRLWRHTSDIRLMQGIMGHVRTKATSVYVHIAPERMRAARERIGTAI
jgi:integrase